jgi:hypothetical protein
MLSIEISAVFLPYLPHDGLFLHAELAVLHLHLVEGCHIALAIGTAVQFNTVFLVLLILLI